MVARRLHLERERRPLADPLRPSQPGVQRRHPLPPSTPTRRRSPPPSRSAPARTTPATSRSRRGQLPRRPLRPPAAPQGLVRRRRHRRIRPLDGRRPNHVRRRRRHRRRHHLHSQRLQHRGRADRQLPLSQRRHLHRTGRRGGADLLRDHLKSIAFDSGRFALAPTKTDAPSIVRATDFSLRMDIRLTIGPADGDKAAARDRGARCGRAHRLSTAATFP